MDALDKAVTQMLRYVAERIILPRFRALASHEISEKTPGQVVTIADRESEEWLTEQLATLIPGARVVGEEACEFKPELMTKLDKGTVWLVDPLDGTRNFAAGLPHFAVMVALVAEGETQGGWILDPMTARMCRARLGRGAYIDGVQVNAQPTGRPGLVGALPNRYADVTGRARLERLADELEQALPGLMCAGADYPRCVDGTQDFAMFWRSLPWDHAAGALFLEEAGGKIAWPDGRAYRVGDTSPGLMAAASPAIWEQAARMAAG